MTAGSRRNVREIDTFCWLPPDRNSTGCSSDGVRVRRRSTRPRTALRSARRRRSPSTPNRPSDWIVEFTRTPSTGISASRFRSPGNRTMPARTASLVDTRLSSLPSHATSPALGGTRPARQSNNWGWPLPSAPATPTISPLSSSRLTGPNDCPCRPSTSSTRRGASDRSWACGNAASNGRPTISSTSCASEVAAASKVPWPRPSRRTVMRSEISSTSGSRWLT